MIGSIISAAELLFKWRNHNAEKKERIAWYIEKIADEADELARIWTYILVELKNKEEISVENYPIISKYVSRPDGWEYMNATPYSRLEQFYNKVHFIIGEYDSEKGDLLLEKLSRLMHMRNVTRQDLMRGLNMETYDSDKIDTLIESINRQAAEIRNFAIEARII